MNCTGSCSWKVYVKDGIITWETQQTDYPSVGPDSPEYEPRGCPRGAAFSWYTYSPTRVRYPYVRGVLLQMFREAKAQHDGDPVRAWEHIVENPLRAKAYKSARGKGGLVRATWDEAAEIVAAAHVHTIKKYGPDRVAGFSPIPAMSMVSHASGARFVNLIGGSMLSFYDWYADLPVASPQVFGDQTDVPESGDWWNAGYLIMWGSNLPVTRTPDAHWMTEARYRGQKVVAVAPDYADNVKFADEWLPAKPGTDAALAMAMGHVVLKEFFVDRQTPYFTDYVKTYTDLPHLVRLEETRLDGEYTAGKFLTAADLAEHADEENAAFKTVLIDARTGDRGRAERLPGPPVRRRRRGPVEPRARRRRPGPLAARHRRGVGRGPDAALRHPRRRGRRPPARRTDAAHRRTPGHHRLRPPARPVRRRPLGRRPALCRGSGRRATTTPTRRTPRPGRRPSPECPPRRRPGSAASSPPNAEESHGRSMIVMGAGTNHWFHSDTIYRAFLTLTNLTGCQGVNGGGWAHYVGQEKVRPITGYTQIANALDWNRPPRNMIQTAFWYLHTNQFRYDQFGADTLVRHHRPGSARREVHRRRDRPERPDGLDAVVPDLRPQPARPQRRRGRGRQAGGGVRRRAAEVRRPRLRRRGPGRARATTRASCRSGGPTCSAPRARATSTSSSTCSAPTPRSAPPRRPRANARST